MYVHMFYESSFRYVKIWYFMVPTDVVSGGCKYVLLFIIIFLCVDYVTWILIQINTALSKGVNFSRYTTVGQMTFYYRNII